MSASAESAADEPTSISTAKIANDTTESREEPRISVSIDASTQEYPDLELPLTAADGLIKKPFSRPIDTAKPIEPPELTPDQVAKYQSVLETVSSWMTLPESPAKDASTTPVTDEERMYLTQGTLLRYLRASKWNVSEAVNRLHGTLVWRREYLPPLTSDYISIENETGKQLILGYDVTGRPCIIMQPSKQNTETSDRQIQHLVFMLERAVELMQPDQETLAFIVNFNETRTGQNATISQARQAVHILQYHYPERLGRALVINLPFIIWGFMKIVSPFIDPITRDKLRINVDPCEYVPPEQLMEALGGEVEFEYDHSEYWPALNALAERRRQEYLERWVKGGKRVGEHDNYLRGGPGKGLAATESKSGELEEKLQALAVDTIQATDVQTPADAAPAVS
ncbi:hypothetical protein Egran_05415 [Elaphomyces granulatus]|uniref:CRAL-TRIO domain-containing protein n=1 Tax=Elaphomyces granulatus TaxID=519963 RepID=A0A232LS17_9EURO|nr:hypothetical protein Egran_05415 [Elaphomyces granulatus]